MSSLRTKQGRRRLASKVSKGHCAAFTGSLGLSGARVGELGQLFDGAVGVVALIGGGAPLLEHAALSFP
jgi:hypothetical protein